MPASVFLTIPLSVVLLLAGGAALTAGLRGKAGSLSRKSRLGVHGPAAEASDEAFAVANRVAAPVVIGAGAVLVVGAACVVALRLSDLGSLVIFFVALVAGIVLLVMGGSLGESAATRIPRPAQRPDSTRPAGCAGCACGSGGCGTAQLNASHIADGTDQPTVAANQTSGGPLTA